MIATPQNFDPATARLSDADSAPAMERGEDIPVIATHSQPQGRGLNAAMVSTPAGRAGRVEKLFGEPYPGQGAGRPLFWALTGADFTRAIRDSRRVGNAVSQRIRARFGGEGRVG